MPEAMEGPGALKWAGTPAKMVLGCEAQLGPPVRARYRGAASSANGCGIRRAISARVGESNSKF